MVTIKLRNTTASPSVTSVSDSTSGQNAWQRALSVKSGAQAEEEIWYASNAQSVSSVSVTATANSAIAFTVLDVSGVASPDATATGFGSGTAASTGTAPATAAPEVAVAAIGWNASVTPSGQSPAYTLTGPEQSTASGSATGEQAAYEVLTATGPQSYAATLSGSVVWTGGLVTFKGITATPTPTPTTSPTSTSSPSPTPGTTPIKHIVIFYQENHSFDNVLGALCAANTRATPCDGATSGLLPNGTVQPLSQAADVIPDVDHSVDGQTTAIDGGKMDGFANIGGCGAPSYACYTEFEPSQIPNLTALATTFTVSDRTFELGAVPSWGGHLTLVAQTLDGFLGDNPFYNTAASPPPQGNGWGCDSNNDEYWSSPGSSTLVPEPACIPDPSLNPSQYPYGGAYRSTPVQHVDTIMDRLDAARLSWKLYTSQGGAYSWSICPSFADCLDTNQAANMVPPSQFITDAQAGTLPSFSILLPQGNSGATSPLNGTSMAEGDNWIGSAVSAVENGPDWTSTVIFIAYDDCGCFYDHVAPPPGLGIRVPMVIVSPYAKPGYTDSNTASYASMLAYTEHTLGLAPLGANDAAAYDYSDAFNYQQTPLSGAAMIQRPISPQEQAYLAAHPPNPDDPT